MNLTLLFENPAVIQSCTDFELEQYYTGLLRYKDNINDLLEQMENERYNRIRPYCATRLGFKIPEKKVTRKTKKR